MDTTATCGAIRAKGALRIECQISAVSPPRLALAHALCLLVDPSRTNVRPTNVFVLADGDARDSLWLCGSVDACAQRRG